MEQFQLEDRLMALTIDEFRAKVQADARNPKLCGHKGCTKPLGPRVDGEHHRIGNNPVCEDCYYADFGNELESSPVISPRLVRGGSIRILNQTAQSIEDALKK